MSATNGSKKSRLDAADLPQGFADTAALDDFLAMPTEALCADLASIDGDIMILGAGGKMGPSLARLAFNAAPDKKVYCVARFSDENARRQIEDSGIQAIACDLLDRDAIQKLPKVKNIIFMAGRKFGSDGNQPLTWASNAYMPTLVAEAFPDSRIVAFSTGCVYAFSPVTGVGSDENAPLNPPGEYANSCIARERLFEYFSAVNNTPGRLFRLNYAIDLRYGVLHDIAVKVRDNKPIDVTMGHVNVIWQGDANSLALRCLAKVTTPTTPINVTGPEVSSVRELAETFGKLLGRKPQIVGKEADSAWLSDTRLSNELFGKPVVSLEQMIAWTADWVSENRPSHNKPTHFEARDGAY